MNEFGFRPENNERKPVLDIANIENMSEKTLSEIRAKKQAYNDLIFSLDGKINMVSAESESGSNSPDDEAQEETQDEQNLDLIGEVMNRARMEMARLGKEELELKEAA